MLQLILDWLIYKNRGHVQPDDPNDEDYPIITGPGDARIQQQIDEILAPPKKKDS